MHRIYLIILKSDFFPETQYKYSPWLRDHVSYTDKGTANIIIEATRRQRVVRSYDKSVARKRLVESVID
jgi:hypothetical protein